MNAENQSPDDLVAREAASWIRRRREVLTSIESEQAFRDWYAAAPQHATTYDEMLALLDDVKRLPDLGVPSRRHWALSPRLLVAAMVALLCVGVLSLAILPRVTPRLVDPHTTQIAQVDHVRLNDGSIVTLGAASTIDVRFTPSERRVRLAGGEAFFEVTHDTARPFIVEVGDASVRVVGTKFNVNLGAGRIRVAVLEGRVEVHEPSANWLAPRPAPLVLSAGQRIEVRGAATATLLPVEAPPPAPAPATVAGAWRDGRFVYEDVRLEDIVADINRYRKAPVVIADSRIAAHRLTTSFSSARIESFVDSLPGVLDAQVAHKNDGRVVISRR